MIDKLKLKVFCLSIIIDIVFTIFTINFNSQKEKSRRIKSYQAIKV